MRGKPLRTLFTFIMDALVLGAILEVGRIVVLFFGQLHATEWGAKIVEFTALITFPLGVDSLKTPYGGVFDMNAALTVVGFLVLEWLLSLGRGRA